MKASDALAWLRCAAWLAAGAVHPALAASDANTGLEGCWRGERTVLHFQDGTTSETRTRCTTRYQGQRFASACPDPAGREPEARMEGRYEVIGDGVYVATLTRHNRLPAMVGKRSTMHFHLAHERLVTMAYPPRMQGAMKQITAVESTSVRMRDDEGALRCPALPGS